MHRVLVLGVPRSGTTWIGEVLGTTERAAYVHEPDGVHEPFAYRAKGDLPAGGRLEPGASGPDDYVRLWAGAFEGGAKAATLADHVSRRCYSRVTAAERAAVRAGGRAPLALRIATRAARPRVAVEGLDHVIVKSVDAALSAEWIVDRFEPTVVVVARDLRSVLASWVSLGMAGPREPAYSAIRAFAKQRWSVDVPDYSASVFERAATVCAVWAVALADAARTHGWLRISHDAVLADPSRHLEALARTAGLEWGARAEAFVAASNAPGEGFATRRVAEDLVDSWKRRLSDEQIDAVESVLRRFPDDLLRA